MELSLVLSRSSTPPRSSTSLSLLWYFGWFRHSLASSRSSVSFIGVASTSLSLSSGGWRPFSRNLSKWFLIMSSIPPGRLGNGPEGRFTPSLMWSQKHRSHSINRLTRRGDSL